MTARAGSGHPGGSCSIIDVLSVLYATINQYPSGPDHESRDRVVFSAGHLAPAAYAVLAESGFFSPDIVIDGFRRAGSPFEGHIMHAVPGVEFTNGSLGKGISQAAGLAHAAKLQHKHHHVYVIMGDGEQEEGQVAEARRSITKYNLSNVTIIIDSNGIQLEGLVAKAAPTLDIKKEYLAAGFVVYEIDGHDFGQIHHTLMVVRESLRPSVIIARTVMGKGISFMEAASAKGSSEWHGTAPTPEQANIALRELVVSDDDLELARSYDWARSDKVLMPDEVHLRRDRENIPGVILEPGVSRTYAPGMRIDNRTAYGNALLDIGSLNPDRVIATTCDLVNHVKMADFAKQDPAHFIDEGVSEQHMVSKAGAMSLSGFCVFASTFGVFLSALAADQVRINDINHARVKMVATHCGLSVGEDGMTHQCVTDLGFMQGLYNTVVVEPADPNHTDHAIRAIANIQKQVYVRLGRALSPIIVRVDGSPFYDGAYRFLLGKMDVVRRGNRLCVIASGAMVAIACRAIDEVCARYYGGKEVVCLLVPTSLVPFDEDAIVAVARVTSCILSVEDHNPVTGLGSAIARVVSVRGLDCRLVTLGPVGYGESASVDVLYQRAGLSAEAIRECILRLFKKIK